jgi:hypothetical protein
LLGQRQRLLGQIARLGRLCPPVGSQAPVGVEPRALGRVAALAERIERGPQVAFGQIPLAAPPVDIGQLTLDTRKRIRQA